MNGIVCLASKEYVLSSLVLAPSNRIQYSIIFDYKEVSVTDGNNKTILDLLKTKTANMFSSNNFLLRTSAILIGLKNLKNEKLEKFAVYMAMFFVRLSGQLAALGKRLF
jgi:hypothetical protein